MEVDRAITAIQTEHGVISTDPQGINDIFTSYYKTLYMSPENVESQTKFLDGICSIPSILDDFKAHMIGKLEALEIADAICQCEGR